MSAGFAPSSPCMANVAGCHNACFALCLEKPPCCLCWHHTSRPKDPIKLIPVLDSGTAPQGA
eukprot:1153840-Pelagomonas_calceolata.AAC.3